MATPDFTNSQRSLADRNAERAAEEGGQFTTGDWEAVDYWYNQHLSKRNPAAQIANPSALALITFAITTGLLQVGDKSAELSGAATHPMQNADGVRLRSPQPWHCCNCNPFVSLDSPGPGKLLKDTDLTILQGATTEWVPATVTHIASTTMFCVGGICAAAGWHIRV